MNKVLNNHLQSVLTEVSSTKLKKVDINSSINSFAFSVFHFIYHFGRVQTKPFKLLAERFQEIRFEDSTHSINRYAKIKLLSIAVCSIVVGLLSIPGFSLTYFAKFFSRNFCYSPAQLKSESKRGIQDHNQLKVMTWNTGLGPGFMSIDNRLKKPEERIDSILEMIDQQDANILSLQEVFDEDATNLLVQELNKRGYDCVHSVLGSSSITLSSGLLLAVKRESGIHLEIEEIKVWKFRNLAGADALANKGLLGLKLNMVRYGVSQTLHLFNTHLQASTESSGFGDVRQEQVAAISNTVKQWTKGAKKSGVVLCGDLNFGLIPLEKSDDKKLIPLHPSASPEKKDEYDVQFEEFEKQAQLFDPNRNAQSSQSGTFYDLKNGTPQKVKSVIDYILTNEYLRKAQGSTKVINLNINDKLMPSDHCPLVHELDFSALSLIAAPSEAKPSFESEGKPADH